MRNLENASSYGFEFSSVSSYKEDMNKHCKKKNSHENDPNLKVGDFSGLDIFENQL